MARFHPLEWVRRGSDLAREVAWTIDSRLRSGEVRREYSDVRVHWPQRYDWELTAKWMESLRVGLVQQATLIAAEIPQPYERIVLFEIETGGRRTPIAIDYADRAHVNERCVRDVRVYFKMQFRREGYGFERVLPGGFVPGSPRLYDYLRAVRRLRSQPKRTEVFGRFSTSFAKDVRTRAVELLQSQRRFRFEGGLKPVRYSRFLRELAQARVCLDLPGNGDFCFRLVDSLAIGSCVVAVRHGNRLPVDLIDGVHVAFVKPDLSDLVETCARYVEDDHAREAMARNAMAYFDEQLHRSALARYFLRESLARIEGRQTAA